jgi:rhodanese-related sulfurtransferase
MKTIKYLLILSSLIFSVNQSNAWNSSYRFFDGSPEIKADTTFRNLTLVQADSLIDSNAYNPDFVIIDLRTPADYNAGHINHAININYYAADFDAILDTLDKTKAYLIYCQSGSRSGLTFTKMRSKHFVVVYNMLGGFSAWRNAGYPYVTGTTGLEDQLSTQAGLGIFPNPASRYFYIETGDSLPENTLVEMYNVRGVKVVSDVFGPGNKIHIDAGNFVSGMYYCRTYRPGMPVKTGKILIKK